MTLIVISLICPRCQKVFSQLKISHRKPALIEQEEINWKRKTRIISSCPDCKCFCEIKVEKSDY